MLDKLNRLNGKYEYLSNLSQHYADERDFEMYTETRQRMTKLSIELAQEKVRVNNLIRSNAQTLIINH